MSTRSKFVQLAHFRVMYRLTRVGDQLVSGAPWRDYYGRSFTYMDACERAEGLRGTAGLGYRFKVLHEKLVAKEA